MSNPETISKEEALGVAVKQMAKGVKEPEIKAAWLVWLKPRAQVKAKCKIKWDRRVAASVLRVEFFRDNKPEIAFLVDIYNEEGERRDTFQTSSFGQAQDRIKKICPKVLRASLVYQPREFVQEPKDEEKTDLPDVPAGDGV